MFLSIWLVQFAHQRDYNGLQIIHLPSLCLPYMKGSRFRPQTWFRSWQNSKNVQRRDQRDLWKVPFHPDIWMNGQQRLNLAPISKKDPMASLCTKKEVQDGLNEFWNGGKVFYVPFFQGATFSEILGRGSKKETFGCFDSGKEKLLDASWAKIFDPLRLSNFLPIPFQAPLIIEGLFQRQWMPRTFPFSASYWLNWIIVVF